MSIKSIYFSFRLELNALRQNFKNMYFYNEKLYYIDCYKNTCIPY